METEQPTRRRRSSLIWMICFIILAVGAAVGANLWKRNLKVVEVLVSGNSIVSTEEVLARADIRTGSMLFAVDLGEVQRRVLENQYIRSAAVNRDVPNRISITVEERVPIAAVVTGKILYLDTEGYVLPGPHLSRMFFDLPVLSGNVQERELIPGTQVRTERLKEALSIVAVARMVNDDLYRMISEVVLQEGDDMILYTAESGVPVVFGRGNVAAKLVKLDGFWKEFVQPVGASALQYIDLRFEDQVVARWREGKVSS